MVGFSREGENPWREKSWSCAVLQPKPPPWSEDSSNTFQICLSNHHPFRAFDSEQDSQYNFGFDYSTFMQKPFTFKNLAFFVVSQHELFKFFLPVQCCQLFHFDIISFFSASFVKIIFFYLFISYCCSHDVGLACANQHLLILFSCVEYAMHGLSA